MMNLLKKYSQLSHCLLCIILSLSLMSCAEQNLSDLEEYIAETKAKYIGKVEALPAITPYESYQYGVLEKRNPFKPSVSLVKSIELKRTTNGIQPSVARNKEELEKYALETLYMVGIMNNDGQQWALIKAPDNSIFRVREGNYMGENHGKIIKISESKIDLKEIVSDGLGGWIERANVVGLSE